MTDAKAALILVLATLGGCIAPPAIPVTLTPSIGTADWYEIYFTDPASPSAETWRGGPDAALAAGIAQARLGVDVAMDTLDLWSLRDTLIDARRRANVTNADYSGLWGRIEGISDARRFRLSFMYQF